jgi:acetyltransferase-like isoleucine patch superfamily enzyme
MIALRPTITFNPMEILEKLHMSAISRIMKYFFPYYWDYIVRFRANKVAYLRYLGVRIGENCDIITTIGNFGSEPWLVELGRDVTVTNGVIFCTHDGSSRLFLNKELGMNRQYGNRFGTIWIGDNSFIGVNTVLLPNIKIGPDAIVGVGSVVNRDVPPETVFAGNPARQICSLQEYIDKYKTRMIPIASTNRVALRKELTSLLWGEKR